MKITKHTPLADCIYFMNAERWMKIVEQVTDRDVELQGWKSLHSHTIGEFIELSEAIKNADYSYIVGKFFVPTTTKWWQWRKVQKVTLWQVAVRIKWLFNELERVAKFFEQLDIPADNDEKQAGAGINFLDGATQMLIFAQQKFFLHSLEDAENVKLCDYMALKKNEADGIKYQRTLMKIHQKQHQQRLKTK